MSKVIYKPESKSTDEYTVFVDADEYKKWKGGDASIQIDQVTDTSDIFFSSQGKQGLLGNASKSQLAAVFGNDGDSDKVIRETAVRTILEKGVFHAGGGISGGSSQQNDSRGGGYIDTRGSGGGLHGI